MHALIDGDVVVYAAGFASDAAAKKVGEEHEPLHHCLHGVGEMLNGVRNTVDATKSTIYLSHPVNFREQLYPAYKANRDPTHKPHWYNEIKDYLLTKGAVYSESGDEADDALGIAQMELMAKGKASVICTNDKDLDMIPGLHYNWSKTKRDNGVYHVDEWQGLQQFYTQLITGDSTDNIPGIFQHTGQKATQAIKDGIDFQHTEQDLYNYVLQVYKWDTDFVHMIAPLLWIKRERGQIWSPPI